MTVKRQARWGRCVSVLVVLLGVFSVLGCSQASPPPAQGSQPAAQGEAQRIEVRYAQGAVQGGVQQVPVQLGRPVTLVVTSDVADEVHLHGYDRSVDVPAGGSATLEFVADRAGVFEAELESRGEHLVLLEVR